jgi:ribosomal protein S18 acetylase RimI-like enzyme
MSGWAPPDRPTLFAAIGAGWAPAESVPLGGWVLRRGLGGGRRASSVWPAGEPGLPLDEAIAAAEAQNRAWGQPAIFQISPADTALDAALAARGYRGEARSPIMAASAETVAEAGRGKRMALKVRAPLVVLEELWNAGGIGPARRAVMARTAAPKEIVMLREDDRVAAAAFVAVRDGIAVMSALLVAPPFRRRGLGREAVAAAARIGLGLGAHTIAFSVEGENAPAIALYEGLGLEQVSKYHYRVAPKEATP